MVSADRGARAVDHPTPPRHVLAAGLRLTPGGVLVAAERGGSLVTTWTTPALDRLLGVELGEALGLDLETVVVHPIDGGAGDVRSLAEVVTAGPGQVDVALRHGSAPPVAVRVAATRVEDGTGVAWGVVLGEIDEQVRADARLRESEERFRTLAAQAPIGIVVSDVGLRLGFVNERALHLWDRSLEVMRSSRWLEAIIPDDREIVVTALAGVLAGGDADVPLRITREDGAVRSLRMRAAPVTFEGRGAGFIASLEDTTAQQHHEEQLRHAALHDPLTGLPNRTMLDQVLGATVAGRRHDDAAAALLFFDLDDFKGVNDTYGHTAGDEVLVEVATRLSRALRDDDLLARFGGDEFVVLCRQVPDVDVARAVAERMRRQLSAPVVVGDHTLEVGVSVGVAMLDGTEDRPHQLLRDADAAMYLAKRAGRGRVVVYEEEDHRQTARGILADELREAIAEGAVDLAWQPIVRLADRRVTAVEVLLRWDHPVRGPVPAGEVLGLAEEHDLLGDLGASVLERACEQMATWHRTVPALASAKLCVNVARQQVQPVLATTVAVALARTGMASSDLVLEVTEQALLADPESGRAVLARLDELGVAIAVDDFGAGVTSITALRQAGAAMVKIDQGVISRLADDDDDAHLVAILADLGRAVGATVVAEGVETPAQLALVVAAGCDAAQGYLLAQPMSAAELEADLVGGLS
jgi:diguanylate cyclase (GGDEF)-like protein/PAS domain S-box-containing protein